MVAARGLGLTFRTNDGPVQALADVDLSIRKGEFVSFIGPSGCGKTTFLRVIADLEKPTAGTISVNGMSPEQARERRAYGYVFQAAALYPWRTIERNVALPLEIMGVPREEQKRRIKSTLEMVNLAGFEHKYPWQLSGGMQQRAAIVRALSLKPSVLLMDEPFGALDSFTRDEMNRLVEEIWLDRPTTIVFITHSIEEAIFLSDRVIVLSPRPGRVAKEYKVPFPRPRSMEIMATKGVFDLTNAIKMDIVGGRTSPVGGRERGNAAPVN
ncbi:ABC transporter ATP-binding protein [Rhizobiaceae sp. 2RAB30]